MYAFLHPQRISARNVVKYSWGWSNSTISNIFNIAGTNSRNHSFPCLVDPLIRDSSNISYFPFTRETAIFNAFISAIAKSVHISLLVKLKETSSRFYCLNDRFIRFKVAWKFQPSIILCSRDIITSRFAVELKVAGLFKFAWPFRGQQALKALN